MSIYKTTIFTVITQALKKEAKISKIKDLDFLIKKDETEMITILKVIGTENESFEKQEINDSQSEMFLKKMLPYIKDAISINSLHVKQREKNRNVFITATKKDGTLKSFEL